jgi:1-acyl-sn-glycerol-3-phosphate acyltransferase
MLRTVAFFPYLGVLMMLTVLLFPAVGAVRLFADRAAHERFLRILTGAWARHLLWFGGVPVEVENRERPPATGPLCVVSNHQGDADILLVVGFVPRLVGFIAKRELTRVPIISWWMRAMHCVFLERASARQALEAIDRAVARIADGQAMILFPEGTRSRSRRMGSFRAGSMKLPKDAGAPVLPVTIDGTYRLFEQSGMIRPAPVKITFHPVVPAETVRSLSRRELAETLESTIRRPLEAAMPEKRT